MTRLVGGLVAACLAAACASPGEQAGTMGPAGPHVLKVAPGKYEFANGGGGDGGEPYVFAECLADGRYSLEGVRDAYLMGMPGDECSYRETARTDTVFAFRDSCPAPDGAFKVDGRFQSFGDRIEGHLTARMKGEGEVVQTFDAHRIGDCD